MQAISKTLTKFVLVLWAFVIQSVAACGHDSEQFEVSLPRHGTKLVVGTKHIPPFAFKTPDGEWTGISVEMWKHLADELNLEYEWRELTLDQMIAGLETGEIDIAVAAISVTAERHQRVDFCHPHFTTGLGVAVPVKNTNSNLSLLRRILSARLLVIIAVMIGIVLGGGMLFWMVERQRNESMFGGGRRHGIGVGVWWSTVLLLGHKGVFPVSVSGRIVAACSMMASIMLFSLLTGVITSVLTVQQLETGIEHPSELRHIRTLTVESSTSADYLRRRRIRCQTKANVEKALNALSSGEADAVVYDKAILQYLVNNEMADRIQVLPVSFNEQEYALALRADSPLRKRLNESLLRYRASDQWDDLLFRYLGE